MIAYRGPVLIAEPQLRWPILLLAAAITALLALMTAGLYYVAMTSPVNFDNESRVESVSRSGSFLIGDIR